ncbi:MAG: GNAT family N-acetyltransferase [Draconibacterium sp.]|nr:GNAT family N-acetyltransferase [Draconibacterium sp.]
MTQQISDTGKFIQSVINQPVGKKNNAYSIWFNEEFAGLIGFKDTDRMNWKIELAYWLAAYKQGKGIATMCVDKLIRYAFLKLKNEPSSN